MSAVTEPTGSLPIFAAYAVAASTICLTFATRGYFATRSASATEVRATFLAAYDETSPVAGSTVRVTWPTLLAYSPVCTIGRLLPACPGTGASHA